MTTDAVLLVCRECWEEFDVESSRDVDRCQRCADDSRWSETDALTAGGPRLGRSGHRAGADDLLTLGSAGRNCEEV